MFRSKQTKEAKTPEPCVYCRRPVDPRYINKCCAICAVTVGELHSHGCERRQTALPLQLMP